MSAMANTSPPQADILGGILERLNRTVTQVSHLRQSLGNLEIELIQIRNQCENACTAAAATAKVHSGDRTTIIQDAPAAAGGHPKTPSMPNQIPLRPTPQPPTQPSPFSKDIDLSSYPFELKHKGDDWLVLYNPSPKVKRVLEVSAEHTLMHDCEVSCAKFSWDGKWLATGCFRMAHIYDVKTGIKTHILNHEDDEYLWSVTFSPDGKYLATGGENKRIMASSPSFPGQLRADSNRNLCITLPSFLNGRQVWDFAKQQIHDILKGHEHRVWSLHFSPNSRYIVSGSRDGTVRIWDIHNRTFKVLTIDGHYLSPDHRVWSVTISPDGRYVAVGSVNKVVSIWEITTGVLVQTLRGHTKAVRSVAFTPDGKGLISGSLDAVLKYWDVSGLSIGSGASRALMNTSSNSSSPCLMNLTGHKSSVYSTAVSHDGTLVISVSHDRNILFWDLRTGVAQCMLSAHKDIVPQVDFSPIGNTLVTACRDGKVRIWSYRSQ